jgi:hypothetical protein
MSNRLAALVAILATAIVALGCSAGNNNGKPIANGTPNATQAGAGNPPPPPPPAGHVLTPADITLAVKVLKKECFGSAGCNVTYTVAPSYTATVGAEPNSSWDVTYEIKGGSEQQINTLHMSFDGTGQHGSFQADSEEMISTGSAKAQLTAAVTEVSKR